MDNRCYDVVTRRTMGPKYSVRLQGYRVADEEWAKLIEGKESMGPRLPRWLAGPLLRASADLLGA
jgi:hypothetical protein